MATVDVDDGSLQADSQPESDWSEGWRPLDAFIKMNQ